MKPECSVRGLISKGAMCGHVIVGGMKCGYSGECSHKRAPASAQAWHDAPTCAGLWLNSINAQARQISAVNIEQGIFDNTGARWFGPIQEYTK